MKKPFLLFFTLTLFITNSQAQEFDMGAYSTFKEAKEAFYKMAETTDMTTVKGYKQFKRMECFIEARTYPSFELASNSNLLEEYQQFQYRMSSSNKSENGNWQPLGPSEVPSEHPWGHDGGAGRINKITLDPNNPDIIWLCTPSGGIWKSTDGGNTWNTNTDLLANIGSTDMAINYQNTDIMYVLTGDYYGINRLSSGVMKSIDGGLTWNTTGYTLNITSQFERVSSLIMSPTDPDVLLVSSFDGVWRSTDGAATWVKVINAPDMKDIKFKPNDGNTVYASGAEVYRSTNGGATFTQSSTVLNGDRISLSVSPVAPNMVYAYSVDNKLWKSSNEGLTFGQEIPLDNHYSAWAHELEVSPFDTSVIGISGLNFYLSSDGGLSKSLSTSSFGTSNYAHVDHRAITWHPTDSLTFYVGSDGGINKTTDGGVTWTDLSNGLNITQFDRMGVSQTNGNIVMGGSQDNGTCHYNGSSWSQLAGGDGMECIVDYSNENIRYLSSQQGSLRRSTNGGLTYASITPPNSSSYWFTNYVLHPTNPNSIYYGGVELWKSTDAGANWTNMTNGVTGGGYNFIQWEAVSEADTQVVYISTITKIYRTIDDGANWTEITNNLSGAISCYTIDPTDANHIWLTSSSSNKVYESTNGGANWINISGTLPDIPMNSIVHDKQPDNGLYLGTDFGIFYKNNSLSDWIPFMSGLPNVIVTDMEIQYADEKIVAGTYGRGMWESDLYSPPVVGVEENSPEIQMQLFPNPASTTLTVSINAEIIGYEIYSTMGQRVASAFNKPDINNIDVNMLPSGNYMLVLSTADKHFSQQFTIAK